MLNLRILSPRAVNETWKFAALILLALIVIATFHRRFTDEEYFSANQRARLKSVVGKAVKEISKNQNVQDNLLVLDTVHQLVNDNSSEKILGFRLSTLYSATAK